MLHGNDKHMEVSVFSKWLRISEISRQNEIQAHQYLMEQTTLYPKMRRSLPPKRGKQALRAERKLDPWWHNLKHRGLGLAAEARAAAPELGAHPPKQFRNLSLQAGTSMLVM
jgi:hypothetical protein